MSGAPPVIIRAAAPDPTWRAPAWPGWSGAYLDWEPRDDGEAGLPDAAIQRLAAALAAAALVVFPAAVAAGPATAVPWLLRRHGAPARARVVRSRDPGEIATLFDQTGFDWTQRGQLVLLFDPATPPAAVAPELLFAAMADPDSPPPAPCAGVLRPGTDGDFAELLCRDAALREAVLRALGGAP